MPADRLAIAHVNDIAWVATVLAAAQRRRGDDAVVIEPAKPGARLSGPWKAASVALRLPILVRTSLRLRGDRYDIVHVHYASQAIVGPMSGRPYVVHCHGTDVRNVRPGSPNGRILQALLAPAGLVLYSTPDLDSVRRFRPDAIYLPNPIDVNSFTPGEPAQRDVLVAVNLSSIKGAEVALAAVEELLQRRPNTTVTVVAQGPLLGRARRQLGNRVAFVEPVPHEAAPDLIRRHRMALGQFKLGILSQLELEAMACGVPVAGDFRYESAYQAAPPMANVRSASDAADAVATLLDEEDRRRALGEQARAWVIANHAADMIADRLDALYREMLYGDYRLRLKAQRTVMSTTPSRRLTLAFLGDPNSIHTRRWLGFFAARGHAVHLILASEQPLTPGLDERITTHSFPPLPRRASRFLLFVVRSRGRLRQVLGSIKPDIVHAHYLTGYGSLARLSGFRPYVITVWGSDVFVTPRHSLLTRIWSRLALRGAARVTADSVALAKATVALGARRDRMRLVQFGVDTQRFCPGPAPEAFRRRLGMDGSRVVFVPRAIAPIYRTTVAVNALAELPSDVGMILTESHHDPAYLTKVRELVRQLDLEGRVRFVAGIEHDEMADFYRLADVVLSIPASDGTPVSILEAMACARPIVASDLPSVREWLADLTPERLVPVDDAGATAAAIRSVLEDPTGGDGVLDRMRDVVIERADQGLHMLAVEADYLALADRTS